MYAMQYELTLPADYDMDVIRERVALGGHLLDDRAGLGLKAYVIRERGVGGSPVNQYAPFYLWNDTGAMAHFLLGGGGFQNIVRDFGRPPVRHWVGVAWQAGPARAEVPRAASRLVAPAPVDADTDGTGLGLATWAERETVVLRELAGRDDVHTAALAVDPHHWQAVWFVLWRDSVPADAEIAETATATATERYEVLHLSAPGP
ncbi:protein of unknown function [Actinopolymorpha singaporensis]|uniref:DUF4865 domain-containing protein n=2 Tax=Actinopolymorpha singaporensis TaxID=117157 RepID=A0A1H1VEB3_9ACTN|nr:protein of unknown function [Actinopolymorpha singaporensis]